MLPIALEVAPVALKVLPYVKPFLESLIVHVESLFGKAKGPTKLQAVLNAALPVLDQLAASGLIPGTIDGVSLSKIISNMVTELNSLGVLKGVVPASSISSKNPMQLSLPASFTITLTK